MTRPHRDNTNKWPERGCLRFPAIHFANGTHSKTISIILNVQKGGLYRHWWWCYGAPVRLRTMASPIRTFHSCLFLAAGHRRDLVCSSREWSELPNHHGDSGPGASSSSGITSPRPFFTSLPGLSNLAATRAKGGIYWRQDAGTWTSDIRRLLTSPLFTRTTTEATATYFTTPIGERRPGACI